MAAAATIMEEVPMLYRVLSALLYGVSSFAIIVVNKVVLTTFKYWKLSTFYANVQNSKFDIHRQITVK
ncbi:hypothetical protein LSAT2_005457 [Lamellibrachia satsuma]|nr:hypothetical protein LSAT2_005457 [Lamellibrachia satsuma]